MIAPYDPHGCSAVVMAGRVEGRSRKKRKGMMIIPLDPSGFLAVLVECGWKMAGIYRKSAWMSA